MLKEEGSLSQKKRKKEKSRGKMLSGESRRAGRDPQRHSRDREKVVEEFDVEEQVQLDAACQGSPVQSRNT